MTYTSIVTQQKHYVSDDEDYITLYESGNSFILYVRNYLVQSEFLVISQDLTRTLPEESRTVSGVYLPAYFSVLRSFQHEISRHVVSKGLQPHFYYLFDCTVSDFIKNI